MSLPATIGTAHHQPGESPAILAFHKWFNENLESGCRANTVGSQEDPPKFIPSDKLRTHLNKQCLLRILREVFAPAPRVLIEVDAVLESYCKVFAILLCIKKPSLITEFIKHPGLTDQNLPFRKRPDEFPYSAPTEPDFFDAFFKIQWIFCVPVLRYYVNQHWEPNRILPIVSKEEIGGGGSAVTYKIRLHPSHNGLNGGVKSQEGSHSNVFVLKTFHRYGTEQQYDNEVRAFATLRQKVRSMPGLVTFYGSFVQDNTFHILLEFADGGTLEDYLHSVPPPTSHGDKREFWKSLHPLTQALKELHHVEITELGEVTILCGWHQDINLKNILCSGFDPKSPYRCEFKLADLGLSHFATKIWNKAVDKDAKGTKTFGAPECYIIDDFDAKRPRNVPREVDVWSLGCVLSVAAEWLYHGKQGLERYENDREEEQSGIEDFRDTGCFHNGTTVLQAVGNAHDGIYNDIVNADTITGSMLEVIEDMLKPFDVRFSAGSVYIKTWRIIAQPLANVGTTASGPSRAPTIDSHHQSRYGIHSTYDLPLRTLAGPNARAQTASTRALSDSFDSTTLNESGPLEYYGRHDSPFSGRPIHNFDRRAASSGSVPNNKHNLQLGMIPNVNQSYHQQVNSSSDSDVRSSGPSSHLDRAWSTPTSPPEESRNGSTSKASLYSGDPPESIDSGINESQYPQPPNFNRHDINRFTDYLVSRSKDSPKRSESGYSQQLEKTSDEVLVTQQAIPFTTRVSGAEKFPNNIGHSEEHERLTDSRTTIKPITKEVQQEPEPSHNVSSKHGSRLETPPRKLRPVFAVQDALLWWEAHPLAIMNLPPSQASHSWLLNSIQKRDQIILLDDSLSMLDHWDDVVKFLGLHVFMVQDADPDGVEVFLTSKTEHTKKKRPIAQKELQNFANHHRPKPSTTTVTNMYDRLNTILESQRKKIEDDASPKVLAKLKRKIRSLRPLSVTVYTDGCWQGGSETAAPIKRIMDTLDRHNRDFREIGIQFVQFGTDEEGMQVLRSLDVDLQRVKDGVRWDVVDTEPWTGNMWKILLGPINSWFDDDAPHSPDPQKQSSHQGGAA